MQTNSHRDSQDIFALVLLAAAGFLCCGGPHITQLGFYHDDWDFLRILYFSKPGLFSHVVALAHTSRSLFFRPFDILLYAGLYTLFGLHPLPWQMTLLVINVSLAFTVYKLLTHYQVKERPALLGALLFLAYPSKDATMFWPSAILSSLSLLVFLAAFLCHLRYVENARRSFFWAALSMLLLSLTIYDQCFFLFFLWLLTPSLRQGHGFDRARRSVAAAGTVVVLVSAYKFLFIPYGLGIAFNKSIVFSFKHFLVVYASGVSVNLGPALMSYVLESAYQATIRFPIITIGAIVLPWTAWSMKLAPKQEDSDRSRVLLLLGAGIFVLGYLPIALSDYWPMSFNHMNRINQVPILGLILAAVGALRYQRHRVWFERIACLLASILLAAHVAFAGYWAESYRIQIRVRTLIEQYSGQWPADTTLLLLIPGYLRQGKEYFVADKAPIFVAPWDITGASQIWTDDPTRKADVLTLRSRFFAQGILTRPGAAMLPYESVRVLDVNRGIFAKVGYSNFK